MSGLCFVFLCFYLSFSSAFSKERTYETLYIDVPLDHFSFATNKTFKLKYLLNKEHWTNPNSDPILFYTGNEGDIEVFANHTGFIWETASEISALIVFAEHRYYGTSLPFGKDSFNKENIGYLSSSQALADYVDVILHVTKNKTMENRNPVIAIGGSYGGMLSAYMRMKYPHVVLGAIAASAPIFQFDGLTDPQAFYRIVTNSFNLTNPNCVTNIKKSWQALNTQLSTPDGKKWIKDTFKLCKPLPDNQDGVNDFKDWLIDLYTNLAMVNYPYANDFLAPLPSYPILTMCQYFDNTSLTDKPLLQALSNSIKVYTNFTGKTDCNNITDDDNSGIDGKTWDYQACTEMVMPMGSDGVNDMFENKPWSQAEFTNRCQKTWNVTPQYQLPLKEYGGKQLRYASNIVFSNGLLDPWSSGGVDKNLSNSLFAVLIPEGAHHLDLMYSNPKDPYSVTEARKFHKHMINFWVKNKSKSVHY